MTNPILQSSIWSMLEILRNLTSEERFRLATSCKTLWNFIIQYIPIEHKTKLEEDKSLEIIKYVNNLHIGF